MSSSHNSLSASVDVGNVAMGDDRLGKPGPFTFGFAFFGGNLNEMCQLIAKQCIKIGSSLQSWIVDFEPDNHPARERS